MNEPAAQHAHHGAVPPEAAVFDAALGETSQVALLLDADGLVVAGTYLTADGTDLGAVIGAHLRGVSDEAERAMRHFGLGAWTRILLESEAATVMLSPVEDCLTLVAAPREVPLGFVRRTLDQCQRAARRWLGEGS
jgi:predicted regulator of Ras-like GTPase activity (Roadblock/LC7/MglB family)